MTQVMEQKGIKDKKGLLFNQKYDFFSKIISRKVIGSDRFCKCFGLEHCCI